MISNQENLLNNILRDLSLHRRDKSNLLEIFINDRLNKSLSSYYDSLIKSEDRLLNKDEIKIIRGINKYGI